MFPQTFIYFKYILVFSIIYINLCFSYKKKEKSKPIKSFKIKCDFE